MSLNWRGPEVIARVRQAELWGVNATMAASVIHAKSSHAWQNRTGILEGSIGIAEPAAPTGTGVRGVWGSKDVRYALIHELGGTIQPKNKPWLVFKIGEHWVRAKQVTIPARPYLRPAADAEYPGLADRIRSQLR